MLSFYLLKNLQLSFYFNYKHQTMDPDQSIVFRFPTVRSKLQNLFPFDPKYDIQIIFKTNKYELQTAYLRLESGFFKALNPALEKVKKIDKDFHEVYFQETMKCFYGGVFNCSRSSVFDVWKIFDYLKIDSFKKIIVKDMKHNFDKYNFFELIAFGFLNDVQQIFSNCLNILDNSNFLQLKKNKDQVLSCPLELFKFLINTHNRRPKNKKAINYIQVDALIGEYCEKNQFSDEFYKQLKFQLIQKTELTSQEYRLIFIEGAKSQSMKEIPEINSAKKDIKLSNQSILTESANLFSNQSVSIYQKQHWISKLQSLKNSFEKSQKDSTSIKGSIENLTKSLKRKAEQSKIKQKTLAKMQISVRELEKQINQNRQNLKKITQRIQKLQKSSGNSKGKNGKQAPQEQEEKDVFVESHIIPGYFLGDIMADAQNQKKQSNGKTSATVQSSASSTYVSKKKKSQSELKQQKQRSTEYIYKNSLIFDKEPISVPRKQYLDNLAKILDTDQFVKKRQLNLLFRRSKTEKSNIGDPSVIKNRPALLILFETSHKKVAGGYLSVEIPTFTKADNLCDYQAFIFSLTHNVKMPIMKGEQKSAIAISKHYLISFANDLMISNDCLNEVSYCEWPGIYEVPKYSKCQSAKDLVGTSGEFKIQQIDIYQVKNEQIEMIL